MKSVFRPDPGRMLDRATRAGRHVTLIPTDSFTACKESLFETRRETLP